MRYDLVKIYNYIFGDWADIEKHIKEGISPTDRENMINKRKKEIITFFSDIDLRDIIRPTNSHDLEKILYGTDINPDEETYTVPDEKEIEAHLRRYDDKQRILQDEKGILSPEIISTFSMCYKLSTLIDYKYEKGGLNAIGAEQAIEQAYKMTVLFGKDPKNCIGAVQQYLKRSDYFSTSERPLHDALVYNLPKIDDNKIHLDKWRALAMKHGTKIVKLFNQAPAIEKLLGNRCPETLKEAQETAQQLRFKRAAEHPDLAELFIEYNINETNFNKALDVYKRTKKKDNLPDITIDGIDVKPEYADYHLVKLPINDPNAYVLGHITYCCQSIGGHSEDCVIDGITRENNGFYVLLKGKKKLKPNKDEKESAKPKFPPLFTTTKGKSSIKQINYDDYEIAGQGYAWLGIQGNLVFDSWENRNTDNDNKVITALLKKFAAQVTEEKDSSIMRVTIGTGGKTPAALAAIKTYFPESMKEGFQYSDSKQQATVHCNEQRRTAVLADLKKILTEGIAALEAEHAEIKYDASKLYDWISKTTYNNKLPSSSIEVARFFQKMPEIFFRGEWDKIAILLQEKLLTDENITFIGRNSIREACHSLIKLHTAGIKITNNVLERIQSRPTYGADELIEVHQTLQQNKIAIDAKLLNGLMRIANLRDGCNAIIKLKSAEIEISDALLSLLSNPITEINRIVDHIIDSVKIFRKENITDPAIYSALFSVQQRDSLPIVARNIVDAIKLLKEAKIDGEEDVYLGTIIQCRRSALAAADSAIYAYSQLSDAKLLNEKQLRARIFTESHPAISAKMLIPEFLLLKNANIEKDPDIIKILFERYRIPDLIPTVATQIIMLLNSLDKAGLANDKELRAFVLNQFDIAEAERMISAFKIIKALDLEDISDIKKNILLSSKYMSDINAQELSKAFSLLKAANLEKNPLIRERLLGHEHQYMSDAENIVNAFAALAAVNLDKDTDIQKTVLHTLAINQTTNIIVQLQRANLNDKPTRTRILSHQRPSEAANALMRLHAAKIDDKEIISTVLNNQWTPDLAAQMIVILQEANLANNITIRNELLDVMPNNHERALKLVKAIVVLKEVNCENDLALHKEIFATKEPEKSAQAFLLLKKAKIDHIPKIKKSVFEWYDPAAAAQGYFDALAILAEEKIDTIPEFRNLIIESYSPVMKAKGLQTAYHLLAEAKIEINTTIKNILIKPFGHPEKEVKNYIDATKLLKESGFEHDAQIKTRVMNLYDQPEKAKSTVTAMSLLKDANLFEDSSIKTTVLAHDKPHQIATIIIKLTEAKLGIDLCEGLLSHSNKDAAIQALVLLQQKNLEKNIEIRNRVLNQTEPLLAAKTVLLLKEINQEMNVQLHNAIYKKMMYQSDYQPLFNALIALKDSGLIKDAAITNTVAASYSPQKLADDYIKASTRLSEAKIEIDMVMRTKIIDSFKPLEMAESCITAITLLKEANLDKDKDIRAQVINDYFPDKEAKLVVDAWAKLREDQLDMNPAIRNRIFSHYRISDAAQSISNAYKLLKSENLHTNQENFRLLLTAHPGLVEGEVKKVVDKVRASKIAAQQATVVAAPTAATQPSIVTQAEITDENKSQSQLATASISPIITATKSTPQTTTPDTETHQDFTKKIDLFAKQFQQMVERLPSKTWKLFPAVNRKVKQECLRDLKIYLDGIATKDADQQLLSIIVKFHGELIENKSHRYLTQLNTFLSHFHITIPDSLRIDHSNKPNSDISFNFTLNEFHKAIASSKDLQTAKDLKHH